MKTKIMEAAIVTALVALVVQFLPDLKRYLRMRAM
jgi:hypothetical protein